MPEQGVQPADRVEGVGLPGPVAFLLVQAQGEPVMVQRLVRSALPVEQPRQVLVGASLADSVARTAE